jgi:hypothetical protein
MDDKHLSIFTALSVSVNNNHAISAWLFYVRRNRRLSIMFCIATECFVSDCFYWPAICGFYISASRPDILLSLIIERGVAVGCLRVWRAGGAAGNTC